MLTVGRLSQMVIAASQIQWTTDVTRTLISGKEKGDKSDLRALKKKQVGETNENSLCLSN